MADRTEKHREVGNGASEEAAPLRRSPEGPDLSRRLALTIPEAAAALGISERHMRSVAPEMPRVYLGKKPLIPVDALRAWLAEHAQHGEAEVEAITREVLSGFE